MVLMLNSKPFQIAACGHPCIANLSSKVMPILATCTLIGGCFAIARGDIKSLCNVPSIIILFLSFRVSFIIIITNKCML